MTSKSEKSNQLTVAKNYDVKRMIFSDPENGAVPDSNPPIAYKRVPISTLNEDGSCGDLILSTEDLFSFGVSENINPETKKVNGHVLPLCLWNRNGATAAEKAWTDTFDKIVEHTKKYLVKNREEIDKFDLEMGDLKKFNPLYWKRDKGVIVPGTGPTLYVKLIASKKNNKILSMFFDPEGNSIEPLTLLGKYGYTKAAIKIESIFIGSKITLQIKLYEAEYRLAETGMKPLMARAKDAGRMLTGSTKKSKTEDTDDNTEEKETPGSVENSDVEDNEEVLEEKPKKAAKTVKTPPKAVFRKVVKRVVKK